MKTLEEMMQYGDNLVDEITKLEEDLSQYEYGSYLYDETTAKIQELTVKFDKLLAEMLEKCR